MKFKDLRLLPAIDKCESPGDPVSDSDRLEYARNVRELYTQQTGDVYFPWTVSAVVVLGVQYRKSSTTKIKAEIAAAHGFKCFWRDRGKGPCSDDVEAGHVIARSAGEPLSVSNGMIECRAHNNQRKARTIEDYLRSTDATSDVAGDICSD